MSPAAEEALRRLIAAPEGEFVPAGEVLPGRDRAYVWTAVQELRKGGCGIEGRTRRGYRLIDCDGLVHPLTVTPHLKTRRFGRSLEVLDETDSTNSRLKARGAELPDGAVLFANRQTGGRGRQGRSWESGDGDALQFSLLWKPRLSAELGAMATQAVAAAVARALEPYCPVEIKWPNDLTVGGKKLCGILCEMLCDGEQPAWIVAGVGLNVNQDGFSASLPDATSLALATGRAVPRGKLLAEVLNALEEELDHFETRGPERALQLCRDRSSLLGKTVHFDGGCGQACDIDSRGRLVVRTSTGETKALVSGEAHLGPQKA